MLSEIIHRIKLATAKRFFLLDIVFIPSLRETNLQSVGTKNRSLSTYPGNNF